MPRELIWATLVILAACGSQAASFAGIDCGTTVQGPNADYDLRPRDCVWSAYSNGTAARWRVESRTIEGDPIPETLMFDSVLGVVITRDVSADKFSAPGARRMWTWRCAKMFKVPWATDPSRYSFELSSCTGDRQTTTFP